METAKIKGYLLYAIGEILLVVIGILIALQINNWSEQYKDRQLEQVYYCKLLEDVNQDQLLLEKLTAENESRIKASNEMIQLLQQESPDRSKVANKMRGAIAKTTFTFKPSLAAFDDLKSSGNLSIIRDSNLKSRLLNYYATMQGYADVIDINSEAAIRVYYYPSKDFKEMGFQDIETIREEIDTALVDIEKLKATDYPSAQIRKVLLSDAIFYLSINARKKVIHQSVADEILKMKEVLSKKCDK